MGGLAPSLVLPESEEFEGFQQDVALPEFRWIQVKGIAGKNDFGLDGSHLLVVSERALSVLKQYGLGRAMIAAARGSA